MTYAVSVVQNNESNCWRQYCIEMRLYYKEIYIEEKTFLYIKGAVKEAQIHTSFGRSSKVILGLVLISNIKLLGDIII